MQSLLLCRLSIIHQLIPAQTFSAIFLLLAL